MSIFSWQLDSDRRAVVIILVTMRWFLIGASLFVVNYHSGTENLQPVLNVLVVAAAALNVLLHWLSVSGRPIPTVLVAAAALYDAVAITAAIGLVDGFDNPIFILYYPALLGFALVFRGVPTFFYTSGAITAYALIVFQKDSSFSAGDPIAQKAIVLRLATMAATAVAARMIVRIDRKRRELAVAAEAERAGEVLALERRAREREQIASEERRRLSQEIHDGVSQGVYVLSLSLDSMAKGVTRAHDGDLEQRLAALGRLAKQTLLETRNVLVDLERVIGGQASLSALLRSQAREFSTITGIEATVEVTGEERMLPGAAAAEVYRVLQEGLANVYKHAQARSVILALKYEESRLGLDIADDGIGFDPDNEGQGGHGLTNMRERAERLGGDLTIQSKPGSGTRLVCSIPLPHTDELYQASLSAGVTIQ